MTAHARSIILNKVSDLLTLPNKRVAGVYRIPRKPTDAHVFVDWSTESISAEVVSMGTPLMQERSLTVAVVVFVQEAELDLDALADETAEQVERELRSATLGGLISKWRLGAAVKEFDTTGEKPVAKLTFSFEAQYRTRADAPGVII